MSSTPMHYLVETQATKRDETANEEADATEIIGDDQMLMDKLLKEWGKYVRLKSQLRNRSKK